MTAPKDFVRRYNARLAGIRAGLVFIELHVAPQLTDEQFASAFGLPFAGEAS